MSNCVVSVSYHGWIRVCLALNQHSALRGKSRDCLALNQDNMSKWGDMSIPWTVVSMS